MASIERKFYNIDDFLALPRNPNPWLIRQIVPASGWVSLYGEPKKARKSYLALGMANAIGDKRIKEWLGFPVDKHGHALIVQVDTPHDIWAKRMQDIRSGDYGYTFKNVWISDMDTLPYPFDIGRHEDELKAQVERCATEAGERPSFIIYDTSRAMHQFDENSSQEMTMFMKALENVAGGAAKLLISHNNKAGVDTTDRDEHTAEGGDLMKGMRGSSAVVGAMDTIIKMSPKGNMYFQGRAVGETHKRLSFEHVHKTSPCTGIDKCMGYVWVLDEDPAKVEARGLLNTYPSGSIYSLAQLLAKSRDIDFEAARTIIRRLPEAKGRKGAEVDTKGDDQ